MHGALCSKPQDATKDGDRRSNNVLMRAWQRNKWSTLIQSTKETPLLVRKPTLVRFALMSSRNQMHLIVFDSISNQCSTSVASFDSYIFGSHGL